MPPVSAPQPYGLPLYLPSPRIISLDRSPAPLSGPSSAVKRVTSRSFMRVCFRKGFHFFWFRRSVRFRGRRALPSMGGVQPHDVQSPEADLACAKSHHYRCPGGKLRLGDVNLSQESGVASDHFAPEPLESEPVEG